MRLCRYSLALLPLLLAACNDASSPLPDGGTFDASDAGDSTTTPDSGQPDATPTPQDAGPPDVGGGTCQTDPDCASCAPDGQCCYFSINCQPGSICNTPDDNYYDPTKPQDVCVRVICTDDTDCDPNESCGLTGLCEPNACQNDVDCPAGTICIGGACRAPRPTSLATQCDVVSRRIVLTSQVSARAEAVVRDVEDRALAEMQVTWRSSNPAVATVGPDGQVTAGTQNGQAELQAEVAGIACSGAVQIYTLEPINRSTVRVTAVWSDDGAAVDAASVTVLSGQRLEGRTNAEGTVSFQSANPAESVTVQADPTHVTVLQPGTRDIVISVPRPTWPQAGGLQGAVGVSSIERADVWMGQVGAAMRSQIADVGRWPLFTQELFETHINAPELGLDDVVDMSGSMLWGLGTRNFSENPERCGAAMVGPDDVGCYTVTIPKGVQAAWTLTGALKLSEVTGFANELSGVLSGDVPGEQGLMGFVQLGRKLTHGVDPYVRITHAARVPTSPSTDCSDPLFAGYLRQCRPDYESFSSHHLELGASQDILSVVALPTLPTLSAQGCASYASVTLAADLGPRGLVPLGIGGALDSEDETTPGDCQVAGASTPFGPQSSPLNDGEIALSAAPLHNGLEGYPLRLIAVASLPGDEDTVARSLLIRSLPSVPTRLNVLAQAAFPAPPEGALDAANRRVSVQAGSADFVRLELTQGRRLWVVHAPNAQSIELPDVPVPQAIMQNADAFIITALHGASYGSTYGASSATRLEPNATLEAVASRKIALP